MLGKKGNFHPSNSLVIRINVAVVGFVMNGTFNDVKKIESCGQHSCKLQWWQIWMIILARIVSAIICTCIMGRLVPDPVWKGCRRPRSLFQNGWRHLRGAYRCLLDVIHHSRNASVTGWRTPPQTNLLRKNVDNEMFGRLLPLLPLPERSSMRSLSASSKHAFGESISSQVAAVVPIQYKDFHVDRNSYRWRVWRAHEVSFRQDEGLDGIR